MSENRKPFCPECEDGAEALDRRDFLRRAGGSVAAAAALGGAAPGLLAADKDDTAKPGKRPEKPAEALIKELCAGLSEEQKKAALHPWGDKRRRGMFNRPLGEKIEKVYTKPQQELITRILQAISSGEEGYRQFTRNGTFDGSEALVNCGADVFGDPASGKFAWVFSGHHLTVRCDGDSEPGAAFGGPIYYGHSPNGYSDRNCFHYQTKAVLGVHDALSAEQRKAAIVTSGSPGEHEKSVQLRPDQPKPGIAYKALTKDQQGLVETVMRTILSPYRKEDADEVMRVIKATGGMEKIHLAFYPDAKMKDDQPWHFWRLEGPGFVWNFRVLPHVHTYVNISSKIG